jgi:predicted NAD/FAD-dependent oxidoreductase
MDEPQRPPVAIVGAGVAGLALAHELRRAGHEVTLYEAGRSVGGRIATRQHDGLAFDHGPQYFTARDPRFRAVVDALAAAGKVAAWPVRPWWIGPGQPGPVTGDRLVRHVGVPGMSALPRALAGDLPVETGVRVQALDGEPGRWRLRCEDGATRGPFGLVVVTAPAPLAAALLEPAPALAKRAAAAELSPCLAVLVAVEAAGVAPFQAAFAESGPLTWLARDSSKPGRPAGHAWVLHVSPERSEALLEAPDADVLGEALGALARVVKGKLPATTFREVHRWKHARVRRALTGPLFDGAAGLGATGDWCRGAGIEHAWLAGLELADRIRRELDR